MSEIKNGEWDQYGAKPFEQQQFGTAGIEGVNACDIMTWTDLFVIVHDAHAWKNPRQSSW